MMPMINTEEDNYFVSDGSEFGTINSVDTNDSDPMMVDIGDNESVIMFQEKLKSAICRLNVKLCEGQNRLNIRRKKIWNYFLQSRQSRRFKLENK